MRFFNEYSDNFMLAIVLWPFVSLLLTVPLIGFIYHKRGKLDVAGVVGTYLFVLYILGLGCFTLYPLPDGNSGPGITYGLDPQLNPLKFVDDILTGGPRAIFQIVANILFFLPLGFMGRVVFGWSLRHCLAASFATSLLIECAQLTGIFGLYQHSYRLFDVDDLLWNTSGALIGWAVAAKAVPNFNIAVSKGDIPLETHPGMGRRIVALLIDTTLCYALTVFSGEVIVYLTALVAPGLDFTEIDDWAYRVADLVAFALIQFAIPLANQGKTPAGTWMRMTTERFQRTSGARVVYLLVRAICVYLVFLRPIVTVPIAIILAAACKGMPYDEMLKPRGIS